MVRYERKSENRASVLTTYRRPKMAKGRGLTKRQIQQVKAAIEKDNAHTLETHYYDQNNILVTPTASSPNIVNLTPISQGDGVAFREGDEITLKYLSLRAKLTGAAAGAGDNQAYRIMLLQWTGNQNENAVQIGDILDSGTSVFSHYNHSEAGSFKVWYDEMGTLAKDPANPDHTQFLKFVVDLKKAKKPKYDGSIATNNHMFLVFWSDEATNAPAIRYTSRIAFMS